MKIIVSEKDIVNLFKNFDFSKINVPNEQSKVYKEECVLSFHTAKEKKGLFVCLNTHLCFNGAFARQYYEKSGNGVFLNIKEIPSDIEELKSKRQKFKFGEGEVIEVDVGFEDDIYKTIYSLVLLDEKSIIPLPCEFLPPKIKECVRNIIESDGESLKIEKIRVGESLKKSKYTDNLVQVGNRKIPIKGPWKCDECDLTTNIWLNLTDGHLGCGRRYEDGSGGHNHGVDHWKKTGHPICCKIGTVTPSQGDVYSYAEDCMIFDDKLDEHLSYFGLDRKKMRKTDKTMDELNLDANLKQEFNSVLEKGKKKKMIFGPGLTGIRNIGNSCYLSSVLQVLFSIPEFEEYFFDLNMKSYFSSSSSSLKDPSGDYLLQLKKMCNGLTSGVYSRPSERRRIVAEVRKAEELEEQGESEDEEIGIGQDGISPLFFKTLFGQNHPEFSSGNQQDPLEYIVHLIDLIERQHFNGFAPSSLFSFQMEERFQCMESFQVKYRDVPENHVRLPIPIAKASNREEYQKYQQVLENQIKQKEIHQQQQMFDNIKKKKLREEGKHEELDKLEREIEERRRLQKESDNTPIIRPKISLKSCFEEFGSINYIDDYYSPALRRKGLASKTVHIKTFPKYLIVQCLKYYLTDRYEQRKLDCKLSDVEELDLEFLRGKGLKEGEVQMKEEEGKSQEKKKSLPWNEEFVHQIVMMGFSENAAKRACMETGNASLEMAANWVVMSMGDPHINDPVVVDQSPKKEETKEGEKNTKAFSEDGEGKYELFAFISHIGSNVQSGHYVCHIKKNGKWAMFNDETVSESVETPLDRGYVYFYKRKN